MNLASSSRLSQSQVGRGAAADLTAAQQRANVLRGLVGVVLLTDDRDDQLVMVQETRAHIDSELAWVAERAAAAEAAAGAGGPDAQLLTELASHLREVEDDFLGLQMKLTDALEETGSEDEFAVASSAVSGSAVGSVDGSEEGYMVDDALATSQIITCAEPRTDDLDCGSRLQSLSANIGELAAEIADIVALRERRPGTAEVRELQKHLATANDEIHRLKERIAVLEASESYWRAQAQAQMQATVKPTPRAPLSTTLDRSTVLTTPGIRADTTAQMRQRRTGLTPSDILEKEIRSTRQALGANF